MKPINGRELQWLALLAKPGAYARDDWFGKLTLFAGGIRMFGAPEINPGAAHRFTHLGIVEWQPADDGSEFVVITDAGRAALRAGSRGGRGRRR